ncbi:MAG TPA: LptA/OstA family protein, partial [Verrucomicrobiae bacterium]|nr:LptA/OstA family protein [Verrucomicrobiae bacterium]
LLIDRTNKIFTTTGHAFLKLPSGNSTEGLFAASTNAAPGRRSTNNFIEITSEQYIVLTNSAVFHDGVRVTQLEGNEIKGGMDCRRLDVTFAGTNQIETLLAQTNVVIEQKQNGETNRFLAERGFYTATNGILKLTGNPKWQAGKRQGKGDVLYVDAQKQTLDAVSNAWMRLPASELAANIPGDSSPSKASGAAAPQLEFADIYCHDYTVSAQNAVFREKVRVRHPKMDWDSDEITVTSSPGPEPKRIGMVANRNVVFQLVQPSGQQVHGKCDTAFYDYAAGPMGTNDVLRLTGNAILETTNGTLKNNIIILDHGENKLIAPGNYVIYGTASAFGTNSLAPKL